MSDPAQFVLVMKHGANYKALFEKYQITVVKEKGDGRFIIELPDENLAAKLDAIRAEEIVLAII